MAVDFTARPESGLAIGTAERTLVVLQPGYLPWLGFFDQLRRADLFIYYDDVQFDKHGWRNRNRIKSSKGPHWLTVPVLHSANGFPRILDVEIDRRIPWARKHVATIQHQYARAPFLMRYLPELQEMLCREWQCLVDLDIAVTELICKWLGLYPATTRASTLGIGGSRSERLVNLCLYAGATRYLSGDAAKSYLDLDLFARHKIAVDWQHYRHPVYIQLHGDFEPYLSALDLVLNCGEESARILSGTGEQHER